MPHTEENMKKYNSAVTKMEDNLADFNHHREWLANGKTQSYIKSLNLRKIESSETEDKMRILNEKILKMNNDYQ